jgi:eukaryotic-like serine/threonine-protein kinase
MTPERWQQVKSVLSAVLEADAAERSSYLDNACAEDPSLRSEVEVFLLHEEQARSALMDTPQFSASCEGRDEILNTRIGHRVGPYRIVEEIGVGGMGEVYRAFRADDQYRKEVAIKMIRAGQDSKFVVARFKNERQALASLDHVNIARLLEGGTTDDGVPYFVMELIEGEPLNDYCDHHRLTTTDRLRMFLQVCAAVQFAHQRLIIHRDLKPSNILVTAEGVPKLLDFGIAKILDPAAAEAAEPTLSLFRPLTPGYASPEQVKGESITTASDVYSLGVLLYELLTGHRPYRVSGHAPHEIARAICEFEPERPSSVLWQSDSRDTAGGAGISPASVSTVREGTPEKLSKRLRGDLDSIVLMALRKEPQRRYASVEQYAADIRRHLDNLPVTASKDTVRYRAAKFIRRHKVGFAATTTVVLTLLAGIVITAHEARIARAERILAEQRFTDMRELARSNLFEFHDAIQNLPGSAPARQLVIQRALGYLSKLSQDSAGDRGLMKELAAGYERIASLQGNFSGPGIGDSGAALASYQRAWEIRQSLVASSNNDVHELQAQSKLLGGYLRTLILTGKTAEALQMGQRGLSIAQLIARKQPGSDASFELARAHLRVAWVMGGSGSSVSTRQLPEAVEHDRTALALLAQLAQTKSDDELRKGLVQGTLNLADHLGKNRQFDESIKTFDHVLSSTNGLQGWPISAKFTFYDHRGLVFDRRGDFRRALDDDQKGLAAARAMAQADPRDLVAQIDLALIQGNVGLEQARLGQTRAGRKKLDEAVKVGERMLAANPYELFYKNLLLIGYAYQAEILSLMNDQAGAQARYSHALASATQLAQNDLDDLESRLSVAKLHAALGVVLARAGKYPESRQEFNAALSRFDDLLHIRPQDAEALYVSKTTRDDLAALNTCGAEHACRAVHRFQLPNLNN